MSVGREMMITPAQKIDPRRPASRYWGLTPGQEGLVKLFTSQRTSRYRTHLIASAGDA